jgi:polyhydroxyalkanoate synthesis regulator phasin
MVESLLKKALLFQAEVVAMASEKVQEVAASYVEKGTLHDADAKKFVSEVREKLLTAEKDFEDTMGKASKMFQDMTSSIKMPNAVNKTEEVSLDSEIDDLEKKLEELKIKKEMADRK